MQSKHQAFIIFDSKAKIRTLPMFSPNTETMMRDLKAPCNNPEHQWCKHATDYHLFKVGDVDTESPECIQGHPEEHITNLLALVDDGSFEEPDFGRVTSILNGES